MAVICVVKIYLDDCIGMRFSWFVAVFGFRSRPAWQLRMASKTIPSHSRQSYCFKGNGLVFFAESFVYV